MIVLVADDSGTNRAFFKEAFEAEGFEVVTANDGREALDILRRVKVDAIVSDILMPHVDGYRLCYEVRRDPHLHDIPIVILSASYTSTEDERLAGEFGADRFIRKSPSSEAVVDALKAAIAGPRKHRPENDRSPADLEIMKEYSSRLIEKLEERNRELESTKEKLIELNRQLFQRTQDLSRSEEKFRGIIENVQDIFFRADQNGVIEMVSTSVRRYGYEENGLIGAGIAVLCDDSDDPARLLDALARSNSISDFEIALRTKNGKPFIGSINARALFDLNGRMTGFEGLVRDVTERRHAEQVLREAEERYRSIFENSVEGIIQCLPSGRIITANSAVARILGYDSPADLKASVADVDSCYATPEDRSGLMALTDEEGFSKGREIQFIRKDGSRVWTLARGRAVKKPPRQGFVLRSNA
ncbi:MAG TPA: PAS domain S-box protein [Blastocatellia bacterium]